MTDQPELPGMPEDGPLGVLAKKYAGIKDRIAAAKLELTATETEVLEQMNQDEVDHFKISVGGENYEFECVHGEDSLRCAKITKTIKKPDASGNIGEGAPVAQPEPAAV